MRRKLIIAGTTVGVLAAALGVFLLLHLPGKGPHVLAALDEEARLTAYDAHVGRSWEYLKRSGLFESEEWERLSRTEPVAGALERLKGAGLWPDPSGLVWFLPAGAGFSAREDGFVAGAKVGLLASLADTFAPLFAEVESVERGGFRARALAAGGERFFYAFLGDLLVAAPSEAAFFDASKRAARRSELESNLDAYFSLDVSRAKAEGLFYATGLPYPARRLIVEAEARRGGLVLRGMMSWGSGEGRSYPFRARAALKARKPEIARLVPERAYFAWWSNDPRSVWAWRLLSMTPARDAGARRLSGGYFLKSLRPLLSGEFTLALVGQEVESKERSYPCAIGLFRSSDPPALSRALEEFLRMRTHGVVGADSQERPPKPHAVKSSEGAFSLAIETARPLSGYEPAYAVVGDCLAYVGSAGFLDELRGVSRGERPGLSPPERPLAGWLVWKEPRDWKQLRDFCDYLVETFGSAAGAAFAAVDYDMLLDAGAAALKLVSLVELESVYVPEGLSLVARVKLK